MELAPLPLDAPKHSHAGRFQPFVGVADDQAHPAQAASYQALQKRPPMDFVFGQSHRYAQHGALACLVHAHGERFLRFLPPARRVFDIGQVQTFFGENE